MAKSPQVSHQPTVQKRTRGKPVKEFEQYLTEHTHSHVSHADYLKSPATAFLKCTIEAKDAIELCIKHFPKTENEGYTKASKDSLQYLVAASLPTIMGHFETYQRYLFAGIFDLSVYLTEFDTDKFFAKLAKETSITVDWTMLAAYRDIGQRSIGTLLSDSMTGWHDPEKVCRYFEAYSLGHQLYSKKDIERLKTLWQLRHSIGHTGGTLSFADAQKVKSLNTFGGNQIAFEKQFTFEVARKLHPIIKLGTEGLGKNFEAKVLPDTTAEQREKISEFFSVKSSVPTWLKCKDATTA